MKEFDKYIKNNVSDEKLEVPSYLSNMVEETLKNLPDKELQLQKQSYQMSWLAIAASVAFFFFVFMPNVSVTYAQTLKDVPIIGEIVKVFTIHKEIYEDKNHELDVEIPNIDDEKNEDSATLINKDIEELTTAVIQKFYKDIELSENAYGSIYIDYEVITNESSWFTLKLNVEEVTGSSDCYAKFYHIDREKGVYVQLKDVFDEEGMQDIENYLLKIMKEQMEQDDDIVYFIEENNILQDDTNFYFNENKDLVIVYNKYEITPGYMGCPEFVIPQDVYLSYIYLNE